MEEKSISRALTDPFHSISLPFSFKNSKYTKTKDMNPTLVTLNTDKPNLTLLPPHPPNQLTKQSNHQNLYYNPLMAQIQWNGYSKQSNFSIIIQSLLLNASLEFHVT